MSKELTDIEYLRDLATRLRKIPVMYGTDQGDVDRLWRMANKMEIKKERAEAATNQVLPEDIERFKLSKKEREK